MSVSGACLILDYRANLPPKSPGKDKKLQELDKDSQQNCTPPMEHVVTQSSLLFFQDPSTVKVMYLLRLLMFSEWQR